MEKEQFIGWFHDAFEPYSTTIMGEFLKIDERLARLEEGQRLLRADLQQLSRHRLVCLAGESGAVGGGGFRLRLRPAPA